MDFHLNNASNSQPLSGGSLFPPPTFIFDDSPMDVSDTVIDTHSPHMPAIPNHPITPDPSLLTFAPPDQPVQLVQSVQFVQPAQPALRKSFRPHKAPAYFQDFHCQLASTKPLPLPTTPFPIVSQFQYEACHINCFWNVRKKFGGFSIILKTIH